MRTIWRRFRPQQPVWNTDDDIFERAEHIIDSHTQVPRRMWQRHDPSVLNDVITSLRAHGEHTSDVTTLLATLVLQAPRAVAAQRKMDKHPHGYHDKKARLFELIDFNDTYVSTVLAMPEHHLATFNDRVRQLITRACKRMGLPSFSNEQWDAITHGLTREIAVYRGAAHLGYQVRMTNRNEDAMGVDMVVTNADGEEINLDIKTRSSFHFRLMDLEREGRISKLEQTEGEKFGHLTVINGHGHEAVRTTLLRIDEETYGATTGFALDHLEPLDTSFKQIFTLVDKLKKV